MAEIGKDYDVLREGKTVKVFDNVKQAISFAKRNAKKLQCVLDVWEISYENGIIYNRTLYYSTSIII